MKDNKKYIYNPEQATFYINNKIKVISVGVHYKTNKMFWIFDFNDTKDVYIKWLNNKK